METARVYVTGLTDEKATQLYTAVRNLTKGLKDVKVEIDHPDPPPLFEKEYNEVNVALEDMEQTFCEFEELYEAATLSTVKRDIRTLETYREKAMEALEDFEKTIAKLKAAYTAVAL